MFIKDTLTEICNYLTINEEFNFSITNKKIYNTIKYRLEKYKLLLNIFSYLQVNKQIINSILDKRLYSIIRNIYPNYFDSNFKPLFSKEKVGYDNIFGNYIKDTAKLDRPLFYSIQKPTISYTNNDYGIPRNYQSVIFCKIEANFKFHLILSNRNHPNLESRFNLEKQIHEFDFTNRGGNVPIRFNRFSSINIFPLTQVQIPTTTAHYARNDDLDNFSDIFGKQLYGNICLWRMDGKLYTVDWCGFHELFQ
jgi:hypothetical protein